MTKWNAGSVMLSTRLKERQASKGLPRLIEIDRWEDSSTALRFAQNDRVNAGIVTLNAVKGLPKPDSGKPEGGFFASLRMTKRALGMTEGRAGMRKGTGLLLQHGGF